MLKTKQRSQRRRFQRAFLVAATLFSVRQADAQIVNQDSLTLVNKITSDKEKLAKLQADLPAKEQAKKDADEKAQESADDNRTAAKRLSNDPNDAKKARRADRSASDARSDAKKARRATSDLEDLQKDIRNLTERIEKEESKLKKFTLQQ